MALEFLFRPLRLAGVLAVLFPALPRQSAVAQQQPSGDALRGGDQIVLKVWREPDWSDTLDVDEAGEAVFPRLGRIRVGGIAADSLKSFLLNSYAQYLRNPSIELVILRRVNVLGAVLKPGVYHFSPTTTIADALAAAGGASGDGKPDQVALFRNGQRVDIKLTRDMQLGETPLQSGDQLQVPQRGWMSRNTWVLATVLGLVTSLTVAAVQ